MGLVASSARFVGRTGCGSCLTLVLAYISGRGTPVGCPKTNRKKGSRRKGDGCDEGDATTQGHALYPVSRVAHGDPVANIYAVVRISLVHKHRLVCRTRWLQVLAKREVVASWPVTNSVTNHTRTGSWNTTAEV